jgi:hypothetical protein
VAALHILSVCSTNDIFLTKVEPRLCHTAKSGSHSPLFTEPGAQISWVGEKFQVPPGLSNGLRDTLEGTLHYAANTAIA